MATNSTPQGQDTSKDTYTTLQGTYQGKPQIAYPDTPAFTPAQPVPVGGVILADGDIEYNVGRRTISLKVRNTGDRPVQVGSHFHFFEVNRYLEFDRKAAFGYHLNIPATTAVRFEPGEEKEVELVTFAGKQRIIGFNGLVDYPRETRAFRRMEEYGFKNVPQDEADAEYTSKS